MNKDKLLTLLKSRLCSNGKIKSNDQFGNILYIDTDIYPNELLSQFLDLSLSNFNQIPKFTNFSFEEIRFVNTFSEVLVEGATLYALSSQALIERGREFAIIDNGITFDPPNISEILNTQYCSLINVHFEKIKLIKANINEWIKSGN